MRHAGGQPQASGLWLALEQWKQAEAEEYVPTPGNLSERSKIPERVGQGLYLLKGFLEVFWKLMPSWLLLSDTGKKKRVSLYDHRLEVTGQPVSGTEASSVWSP